MDHQRSVYNFLNIITDVNGLASVLINVFGVYIHYFSNYNFVIITLTSHYLIKSKKSSQIEEGTPKEEKLQDKDAKEIKVLELGVSSNEIGANTNNLEISDKDKFKNESQLN